MADNQLQVQQGTPLNPAIQQQSKGELVASFKKVFDNGFWQNQIKSALKENAGSFSTSLMELVTSDQKLLACNPNQLMAEAVKAASMKLPLNKQLGYAYLLPFKNKGVLTPTLVIGYKGYNQLAMRTGQYLCINNDNVYKGELIAKDKLSGMINLNGEKESDEIEGYFAYFELINGYKKMLYMSLPEMAAYALKNSPTFKAMKQKPTIDFLCEMAQKHSQEGGVDGQVGWYGDFNAMAQKTVLRRLLSKHGYLSIEMAQALAEPGEEMPYITAEQQRNEDNAAPKQVVDASQMMQDAEAEEVNEESQQEAAPI